MDIATTFFKEIMKNTTPIVLLLFCSPVLLSSCSEIKDVVTPRNGQSGNSESSTGPTSENPPTPGPVVIDEKKFPELIKVALWKEYFTELPYEVSEVEVVWKEKSDLVYAGNYTATIKATEKMYLEIPNRAAIRKLLEKDYEVELEKAREKAEGIDESNKSIKTELLNRYPEDNFSEFEFYEIVQAKGNEQKVRGTVELNREDMEDPFRVDSLSKRTSIESGIPDADLPGKANRLDDEETMEKLEKIVDQRKKWIADVDRTIKEIKVKKETDIKEREELVKKFIYQGAKYSGVSTDHEMKPTPHKIILEFDKEHEMTDGTKIIDGKFYNPDAKGVVTTFTLPLTLKADVNADLEGVKREHFNPLKLQGVPRYYKSVHGIGGGTIYSDNKIHIGFHDDNLIVFIGYFDSSYFRGELERVPTSKEGNKNSKNSSKRENETPKEPTTSDAEDKEE